MGNSQYEQISLLGIPTIKILVAYQYPPNMIQKLDGRTSDTIYVTGKSHQKMGQKYVPDGLGKELCLSHEIFRIFVPATAFVPKYNGNPKKIIPLRLIHV